MIPAGLQPGEIEFGKMGDELIAICEGSKKTLVDVPSSVLAVIDEQMNRLHHEALDELGITDKSARREKFLRCNNANFDFTPDIMIGSTELRTEYVQCEQRGKCFVEGRLCQAIYIEGIKFRLSELRIMSYVRRGYSDKEICDEVKIKADTLRSHKRNINRKLNTDRKLSIAIQSIKYGIL